MMTLPCYALNVRRKNVKFVKVALESEGLLNKEVKIREVRPGSIEHVVYYVIATTVACSQSDLDERSDDSFKPDIAVAKAAHAIFGDRVPKELLDAIDSTSLVKAPKKNSISTANPIHAAISKALCMIQPFHVGNVAIERLCHSFPPSYNVFTPMLLLPVNTFDNEHARNFNDLLEEDEASRSLFFSTLVKELRVTHIAVNAPIPAQNQIVTHTQEPNNAEENLLRSPTNIKPLFGDFGPTLLAFPSHIPTTTDFDRAFWVSTRQNGITQIWAPRYTMFSSGNVTEKARVLKLGTVQETVRLGDFHSTGCTAVDLFAGIGYFAFSYAKAGVSKVLCWDLNPWSIEGLRRGAEANNWSAKIFDHSNPRSTVGTDEEHDKVIAAAKGHDKFLVFCESNEHAAKRLPLMRSSLPPIRHVNCGMLPSVGHAWKIAVEALDPHFSGWLHLHETVQENTVEERAADFQQLIMDYTEQLRQHSGSQRKAVVTIDHIEKVKSVGPRLWHIVVDIGVALTSPGPADPLME